MSMSSDKPSGVSVVEYPAATAAVIYLIVFISFWQSRFTLKERKSGPPWYATPPSVVA